MRKLIVALLMLAVISTCAPHAGAVTVTMDDGTKISLDALTDAERSTMLKYMDKIATAKESMVEMPDGLKAALGETLTNPTKLDQWRKMITGTIKDVCNDLNVTVNEFIKTPVGMMVGGILLYRFAGKDFLNNAIDIVIMVPLWLLLMCLWLFFMRYFFGTKLVYDIYETTPEKGQKKVTKDNARKIPRYPWKETNNGNSEARCGFGWFMAVFPIVITFVMILIVLP